jgi:hypothetical protein
LSSGNIRNAPGVSRFAGSMGGGNLNRFRRGAGAKFFEHFLAALSKKQKV